MSAATLADRLVTVGKLGLGVPVLVVALLAMVVVPMPPILLDAFFTFNITLSLIIMLAVIYVQRPLDFAARFGGKAVELITQGQFGTMVAWDPPDIIARRLEDVVGKTKTVPMDIDLLLTARALGVTFGD